MPSDNDLIHIIDLAWTERSKLFIHKPLQESDIIAFTQHVHLKFVYGLYSLYNPVIETPLIIIPQYQMDTITQYIGTKDKVARQNFTKFSLAIGVDKGDDELLSSITNASKIIFGLAGKE